MQRLMMLRISIHAPARGATGANNHVTPCTQDFNPRSREGSDGKTPLMHPDPEYIFQSTLPRGERHYQHIHSVRPIEYFNPRSREGSDWFFSGGPCQTGNFNPRSREGSDAANIKALLNSVDFNPRSREGSDELLELLELPELPISIHAPARGATSQVSAA